MRTVTILRSGNMIVVDPTTDRVRGLLAPQLTFTERTFLRGQAASQRLKAGLPPFDTEEVECFVDDHKGRIATAYGYLSRIVRVLRESGYEVKRRTIDNQRLLPPHKAAFEPRWDLLFQFAKLRHRQDEFLAKLAAHDNGQFGAPPGYGKSKSLLFICAMYPKARILVTSKRVPVIKNVIYPELCQGIPSVGIIGGGKKVVGQRVMCVTFDSLHHVSADWPDIILVDEAHEAGADKVSESLGRFVHSRMFGFSATLEMREDGRNLVVEGLFGPVRFFMPYAEALKHGLVGQIDVHWSNVFMDINPCEGLQNTMAREKYGVWTNEYRNSLIVNDARSFGKEPVLVTCKTVEHVVNIKALCPEAIMIHAEPALDKLTPSGRTERQVYIEQGLLARSEKRMTTARRERRIRWLQDGKPGIYVVTPILNVGFNATRLRCLCRADGGSTMISDTQIPGRLSRANDYKSGGVIKDYLDQFDRGTAGKAEKRKKTYAHHGWHQKFPTQRDDALGDQFGWED